MEKTKGILTEYEHNCMFCGRPTEYEHHFLFGNGLRPLAEADGIKGPCCDNCHTQNQVKNRIHDNPMAERLSKIAGQLAWEKHTMAGGMSEPEAREAFRKRYGRSFL